MNKKTISEFKLIGITLGHKTTNNGGQASIDCGSLWQQFESENTSERIPNKVGSEVYAVYFDYEGDHTQPYSYFVGCKVPMDTETPEGMTSLAIPTQEYTQVVVKGTIPTCIAQSWNDIWHSDIARKYSYDFEVYDQRSHDWSNGEVDIFVASHELA